MSLKPASFHPELSKSRDGYRLYTLVKVSYSVENHWNLMLFNAEHCPVCNWNRVFSSILHSRQMGKPNCPEMCLVLTDVTQLVLRLYSIQICWSTNSLLVYGLQLFSTVWCAAGEPILSYICSVGTLTSKLISPLDTLKIRMNRDPGDSHHIS